MTPTFEEALEAARALEEAARMLRETLEQTEGRDSEIQRLGHQIMAKGLLVRDSCQVVDKWAMATGERMRSN